MAAFRNRVPSLHSFLTQSANLVSASRFLLAYIWITVFFAHRPHPGMLGAIALCGAASDFLDGRIARWTHSAGQFGRWLDNVADIVFILTVLSCEAYSGVIPIYLPVLIAASFAQYIADSILIRGSTVPVKSRLGHWAGIFNYIIVIVFAWAPPPRSPGTLLRDLAPMIGLFYLAAMCERALSYGIAQVLQGVTRIKPAAGE
ncbi:MAG: CDP-alcohol phosphatidyltransferase family protein [Deltaproteobacteria bacterium]|nr:CDP-alcohol phosphatidyltransferase family protein [Deltaproteobacteria bacterium]